MNAWRTKHLIIKPDNRIKRTASPQSITNNYRPPESSAQGGRFAAEQQKHQT